MSSWETYRSAYFQTLSDACVSGPSITNGKNKNILAFIRAGIELSISIFVVLFYLNRRRALLKNNNESDASYMVLPSYEPILYWVVFLQALHIVTVSLRAYNLDDRADHIVGDITLIVRLIGAVLNDGILASVVVLLHRRGSGIVAIRESLRFGHFLGVLATTALMIEIPLSSTRPLSALWLSFASNSTFMICVFVLLFVPPRVCGRCLGFRRNSVINLLRFLAIGVFIAALCDGARLLVIYGYGKGTLGSGNTNVGSCTAYCNDVIFNALWPLAVYLCLRDDSNYWRGISNSSFLQRWIQGDNEDSAAPPASGTTLQGSVKTILRVNGEGTERNLGMLLADRIHKLPKTLPHLDFAFLKMDVSTPLIGSGGSARVFNAKYKGESVALKMVWCVELDENVITDFCRECALIASLPSHPNVLHSLGLCIFPPVLCLVTPLCVTDLFHLIHPTTSNEDNDDDGDDFDTNTPDRPSMSSYNSLYISRPISNGASSDGMSSLTQSSFNLSPSLLRATWGGAKIRMTSTNSSIDSNGRFQSKSGDIEEGTNQKKQNADDDDEDDGQNDEEEEDDGYHDSYDENSCDIEYHNGRKSIFVPLRRLTQTFIHNPFNRSRDPSTNDDPKPRSSSLSNIEMNVNPNGSNGSSRTVSYATSSVLPSIDQSSSREESKEDSTMYRMFRNMVQRTSGLTLQDTRMLQEQHEAQKQHKLKYKNEMQKKNKKNFQKVKDWANALQLSVDACAAVAFLHEGRVVHGDIKSPNFLIRGVVEHGLSVKKAQMGSTLFPSKVISGLSAAATARANDAVMVANSHISSIEVPNAKHRLVIADLGNSRRVDESVDKKKKNKKNSNSSNSGDQRAISMAALNMVGGDEGSEVMTPQWSPPEILLKGKSPSFEGDVFSLAVVLYEILTTEIPFEGVVASEIIQQVRAGVRIPFAEHKPPEVPSDIAYQDKFNKFWTKIAQALSDNPSMRPPAADLLAAAKDTVVLPTPTLLHQGSGVVEDSDLDSSVGGSGGGFLRNVASKLIHETSSSSSLSSSSPITSPMAIGSAIKKRFSLRVVGETDHFIHANGEKVETGGRGGSRVASEESTKKKKVGFEDDNDPAEKEVEEAERRCSAVVDDGLTYSAAQRDEEEEETVNYSQSDNPLNPIAKVQFSAV